MPTAEMWLSLEIPELPARTGASSLEVAQLLAVEGSALGTEQAGWPVVAGDELMAA